MRAAKVQASLRIRAVSPEPSLLAHTSSESRGTFRQKARSLAPLNGWACAVTIGHDGMLEDTNSLDGAHITTASLILSYLSSYLDIISHNGDVFEVQSSINLVHHIKWCWFVMVQCKHQCQRAQSLFTTRQVRDVLPGFLRRPNTGTQETII